MGSRLRTGLVVAAVAQALAGAAPASAAVGGVIAVGRVGGGIVLVAPDGRRVATLTAPRGQSSDWAPAWSPDGARIAFTRTTDGRRSFQVWVMLADGSGARRLTHGRFDDEPAWSPDGRWIAYSSAGGIRLVHPDGSGTRRVPGTGVERADCTEVWGSQPSWTLDGRLAFAFHAESPQDWPASCRRPGARCGWVLISRLDGGGRKPVVRGRDAHWSPDGATVVFTPPDGGVAVVPAGGGAPRFLGRGYAASWSPDGERIVYARMGRGAAADSIWVANRDGRGAHRIVAEAQTPAWRPVA